MRQLSRSAIVLLMFAAILCFVAQPALAEFPWVGGKPGNGEGGGHGKIEVDGNGGTSDPGGDPWVDPPSGGGPGDDPEVDENPWGDKPDNGNGGGNNKPEIGAFPGGWPAFGTALLLSM